MKLEKLITLFCHCWSWCRPAAESIAKSSRRSSLSALPRIPYSHLIKWQKIYVCLTATTFETGLYLLTQSHLWFQMWLL